MSGGRNNGFWFGSLLLVTSLLTALGGDVPQLAADSGPVLTSAAVNHSHVVLTVRHSTATDFSVWVKYWNKNDPNAHEGFIKAPPWKSLGNEFYDTKVKIPGDYNVFAVSVAGQTNLSNAITVIP